MSSLNDLLRQSETTLEVINDLTKFLKEAQDKLNEGSFDNTQMYYLKVAFNKTLTLAIKTWSQIFIKRDRVHEIEKVSG